LPLQLLGQGLNALGRHRFGQGRQGGAGHGEWGGVGGSFPIMIAGWSCRRPAELSAGLRGPIRSGSLNGNSPRFDQVEQVADVVDLSLGKQPLRANGR
jgi:hypothetical protein